MDLSQLLLQLRQERENTATQLGQIDAAIRSLTAIVTVTTPTAKVPAKKTIWTAERRAKLSASLKKAFAAKKKAAKSKVAGSWLNE